MCPFPTLHRRPMAGSASREQACTIFSQIQAERPCWWDHCCLLLSQNSSLLTWSLKLLYGIRRAETLGEKQREESVQQGCRCGEDPPNPHRWVFPLPFYFSCLIVQGALWLDGGFFPFTLTYPIPSRFAPFPIKANQIKSRIIITNST